MHLICNSSLKNSVDVVRTGTQPEIQKYLFHSNGAFDKTQSDYEIFDGVSEIEYCCGGVGESQWRLLQKSSRFTFNGAVIGGSN